MRRQGRSSNALGPPAGGSSALGRPTKPLRGGTSRGRAAPIAGGTRRTIVARSSVRSPAVEQARELAHVVEDHGRGPAEAIRGRDAAGVARTRASRRRGRPRRRSGCPRSRRSATGSAPRVAAACRKRSGAGLPLRDLLGAEDAAVEALEQAGEAERVAQPLVAAARGHAGRRGDRVERGDDAVDGLELGLERLAVQVAERLLPVRRRAGGRASASISPIMYSSERPTKRSITSASVSGQPSSASTRTSIRTLIRSLSTSTPSQSKMTRSHATKARDATDAVRVA